jgi:hypothetical protein
LIKSNDKSTKVSEFTSPNQSTHSHILPKQPTNDKALCIVQCFVKIHIETFDDSIQVQITTNIQLESNHPMYPFDLRITMNIQFQSNNSMYPLDETHRISNIYTNDDHNIQLKECIQITELK